VQLELQVLQALLVCLDFKVQLVQQELQVQRESVQRDLQALLVCLDFKVQLVQQELQVQRAQLAT
jgi:predicted transcriptional regulator